MKPASYRKPSRISLRPNGRGTTAVQTAPHCVGAQPRLRATHLHCLSNPQRLQSGVPLLTSRRSYLHCSRPCHLLRPSRFFSSGKQRTLMRRLQHNGQILLITGVGVVEVISAIILLIFGDLFSAIHLPQLSSRPHRMAVAVLHSDRFGLCGCNHCFGISVGPSQSMSIPSSSFRHRLRCAFRPAGRSNFFWMFQT